MIDTVVVGLGRIVGVNEVEGGPPLNHVAAVRATARLRLTGLVDADAAARKGVGARWPDLADVPTVESIAQLRDTADVVALCTPPEGRVVEIADALRLRHKVLLVEKPLAVDAATAAEIAATAKAAGVVLRINFHRRFDPGHRRLRARLRAAPCKVVMRYGRGLLNYASHHMAFGRDGFPFTAGGRKTSPSYRRGLCPVTERMQDQELMLTHILSAPLTVADADKFVAACEKVVNNRDALLSAFAQPRAASAS